MDKKNIFRNSLTIALIIFALLTVFMSSAVLFDWFGLREIQGNYVPFVVKSNLTAGFIYLISVYGFLKSQKWVFWALLSAALLLIYTSVLYYVHTHTGGLYETRTMGALIFRTVLTLVFAFLINFENNRAA